jgi:UDP-N-acetylglucosamine 2-epimerase (non-hydrolysing)
MTTQSQARVVTVFGTRPEAIKLAPVIEAFHLDPGFESRTIATAQHRDLLDQVLEIFDIRPDYDLDLMRPDQSLSELTSRAMSELSRVMEAERPGLVIVQGDTTTAMVGALAAFYLGLPVAHVEAGLRSLDKRNPFPEEINRQIVSRIADLHFAPTEGNRQTLMAEGVAPDTIVVTGNSGIDALLRAAGSVDESRVDSLVPGLGASGHRLILVTLHRRESFGEPLARICSALRQIATDHPDVEILYPVHPNPNVRRVVWSELADEPRVHLTEPLDYLDFVCAMKAAHLIVTDSGGVQEEAPSLSTPVLVLRDVTERIEAVRVGAARLVGRDPSDVTAAVRDLLVDESTAGRMLDAARAFLGVSATAVAADQHATRSTPVGGVADIA